MRGFRVDVLGPFGVTVDGVDVTPSTGRLRAVLAVLALTPGRPVSWERLATAIWGERLPGNARRSLQTYAGRLRAVLGADRIVNERPGLSLGADPEQVDAVAFTDLLRAAETRPIPDDERRTLVEALSLWRGEPFDGVDCRWLAETEAPRLVERYLTAWERRIDVDVATGRLDGLVGRLAELTTRYPLRESLWARLLIVLDRAGRPAEALDRFEAVRRRLADELGTDPGAELKRLHARLLAGRPLGGGTATRRSGPEPRAAVPRQLPAPTNGMVGRESVLRDLDAAWAGGAGRLFVLSGTAGLGKTTVAVCWAHRLAERFPDGQLYVDLAGFGPGDRPADPAAVLAGFLVSLGTPSESIPDGEAARAALFRTLVADRRVLVLLDNARDAAQVRPLLPAGPGCLTIVTGRDRLAGLIASHAARPFGLALLTPPEGRALLAARLSPARIGREPVAVAEIVAACAGLPLALSVVAARAALTPDRPLVGLAAELRDGGERLDAFASGDVGTDVRAALSWSYRSLSREAGRLFRSLSVHPGREVSAEAAAGIVGQPVHRVVPVVADLVRACLLTETASGRYGCHDLLRAYAVELAGRHDTPARRTAAEDRLIDHYVHTAYRAALLLDPHRVPLPLDPPHRAVTVTALADSAAAMRWFAAEQATLVALIARGARQGRNRTTWVLAWSLTGFLERRAGWRDWVTVQRHALACARASGDLRSEAVTLRVLGRAHVRLGMEEQAREHFAEAYRVSGEIGDLSGQANTLENLGYLDDRAGRHVEALRRNEAALELYRRIGRRIGEADSLNNLGWLNARLGYTDRARYYCTRAIALYRELEDQRGEACAWDSLGAVHQRDGDHDAATDCYLRALEYRSGRTGAETDAAVTLRHLAENSVAAGDRPRARAYYLRALEILEVIGHRDAEAVRDGLEELDAVAAPAGTVGRNGS